MHIYCNVPYSLLQCILINVFAIVSLPSNVYCYRICPKHYMATAAKRDDSFRDKCYPCVRRFNVLNLPSPSLKHILFLFLICTNNLMCGVIGNFAILYRSLDDKEFNRVEQNHGNDNHHWPLPFSGVGVNNLTVFTTMCITGSVQLSSSQIDTFALFCRYTISII